MVLYCKFHIDRSRIILFEVGFFMSVECGVLSVELRWELSCGNRHSEGSGATEESPEWENDVSIPTLPPLSSRKRGVGEVDCRFAARR
jgi:hypothetical protein